MKTANAQMSRKSRLGWSTTFKKELSNIYLKDVNNQRFNGGICKMSKVSFISVGLAGSLFAGYFLLHTPTDRTENVCFNES